MAALVGLGPAPRRAETNGRPAHAAPPGDVAVASVAFGVAVAGGPSRRRVARAFPREAAKTFLRVTVVSFQETDHV